MVLRRCLITCLIVISGGVTGGDAGPSTGVMASQASRGGEPLPGLEKLHEWLALVEHHTPGKADGPVISLITWPAEDLERAVHDLRQLIRSLAEARARQATSGRWTSVAYRGHRFTAQEVAQSLGIGTEDQQRDANVLLKRAALLLTDVALRAKSQQLPAGGRLQPGASYVLQASDGSYAGFEGSSVFWSTARSLLDEVKPDPARDAHVIEWYLATVEYLLSRFDFANSQWQLDHARELNEGVAYVQFQSGFLEEALAARLFTITWPAFIPEAVRRAQPSADTRWERAARYFQNALRADAGLAEARLRLGRVLGLRGRHTDAVAELEHALPALPNDRLRYYAYLFLGDAQAALGRRVAARTSFESSASLFPFAQSPRLALSALARRYGDRRGALEAIQEVLRLPADESQRPDPWWQYHFPVRSEADARLAALYAAWPAKDRP